MGPYLASGTGTNGSITAEANDGEASMISLRTCRVRDAVFWYALLLAFLCLTLPPVRYLYYTVPFLVILTVLGDRHSRLGDEAKPFLVFCLAGIVWSPLATFEGLKDIFFVFAGVSIALLADIPNLRPWTAFWLTCFAMVLLGGPFHVFRTPFEFDFAASISSFEGNAGHMFGLLAVIALLERRYLLFLSCVILAVLALKRIALVGVLIAAVFVVLGESRGRRLLNPPMMIVLNSLALVVLLLYGSGGTDRLIVPITGMSADQLGMGRKTILSVPANAIIHDPHQFIAYGRGPGAGYDHLMNRNGPGKENLHSDLVKILYEYGLVIFCAVIWFMYSGKDYRLRVLFLYLNVLFVTDNTLIYAFLICIFVSFGRHVQTREIEGISRREMSVKHRWLPPRVFQGV
jgi:hypothetical protein